jgi:glycosidase
VVILADYFVDPTQVEDISTDLKYNFDSASGILIFHENPSDPISNLRFVVSGAFYDIPIFRSKKSPVVFSLESAGSSVSVMGSFNGWVPEEMKPVAGVFSKTLLLGEGGHQYLFQIDGQNTLDPNSTDSISNGMGSFNSLLKIGEDLGGVRLETSHFDSEFVYLKSVGGVDEVFAYSDNHRLQTISEGEYVKIDLNQLSQAHGCIRVWAFHDRAVMNDILIPLHNGRIISNTDKLTRSHKHTMQLYFMMVDRFNNGEPGNDEPVDDASIQPIANYLGGDFTGITEKIESGYFDSLGINTLWVSPITENPKDAWGLWNKGGRESTFSGYHGYWPISTTRIDDRLGTDQEFKDLIATAHAHDINILVDHVANHVHQEHPAYVENPEWATSLYLEDGRMNTELWDEQRLTTWFDTFLPTLDFSNSEVVEAMTDSALFWFENYNIDGFRHDATKHVQIDFWRTLTRKINTRVAIPQNRSIYQVGETYGGPELISSYVKSGLLDGQFDFNMYDASVHAFVNENGDIGRLLDVLEEGMQTYGSHHLMANITGNQDKVRFMSFADGSVDFAEDPKKAGWSRDIVLGDTTAYSRLQNLAAFTFFIPGLPVIYYADEIGDIGAGDPDNRRMMRFEDLSSLEAETKEVFSYLANFRKNSMPLLYGDTRVVYKGENSFVLSRKYFEEEVILFVNNSNSSVEFPSGFTLDARSFKLLRKTHNE